jgi:hypothetical protein
MYDRIPLYGDGGILQHSNEHRQSHAECMGRDTCHYEAIKRHLAPNGMLTHLTDAHGAASSLLLHLSEGMAKIAGECPEYYTPGQRTKRYLSKKVQRQLAKHLDVCRYLNSLIALTKEAMQQHHRQRDARTTCVVLIQDVERTSNRYEVTHNTMHTPPPCLPFTLEDITTATSDKQDGTPATALAKLPCWLASLKDLHTTTRQA